MEKQANKNKKKILIVTAFPTHGAGSGALITTQAKSYVENGDEVVIITGNNRTDFDKLEGVKYHIVPFTAETENPEKIKGQCPFNYLMFTTHTESTANFWNVSLEQIEEYNKAFKKAISEDMQEQQFNELFPGNEERVRLLENGYDTKVFYQNKNVTKEQIIPELIGKENTDYDNMVLFVGKFADFKGIDALLDAAKFYEKDAEDKNKKIETIIVGSGALEDKLKKQAQSLQLQHTHFVGRKNHEEICKLQNLATVSLIPSRNEPFGLVVIEGTSCGHPVIATNSGGIPGILNVDKEDLSDETKSHVTKLGVLIPPLPDRPNELDEQEKEELDEITTKYTMLDDEKEKFVKEEAQKLNLKGETLNNYLEQYMRTVNALSSSVIDICDDKLKFNNDEIAEYTEKTYSQEVIRDKILGIFDEAKDEYQKKSREEKC